jgi:hypothetical protein
LKVLPEQPDPPTQSQIAPESEEGDGTPSDGDDELEDEDEEPEVFTWLGIHDLPHQMTDSWQYYLTGV